MSDKELTWNEELGTWELCTVCLDVAYDAAFSQGFAYDEEDWTFVVDDGFDVMTVPPYSKESYNEVHPDF